MTGEASQNMLNKTAKEKRKHKKTQCIEKKGLHFL